MAGKGSPMVSNHYWIASDNTGYIPDMIVLSGRLILNLRELKREVLLTFPFPWPVSSASEPFNLTKHVLVLTTFSILILRLSFVIPAGKGGNCGIALSHTAKEFLFCIAINFADGIFYVYNI